MNKGKLIILSVGVFLILLVVVIFYAINGSSEKEKQNSSPPLLNTKDSLTYKDMIDLNQNNNFGQEKTMPIDQTKEMEERLSNMYGGTSAPQGEEKTAEYRSAPSKNYQPYGSSDMYKVPTRKQRVEEDYYTPPIETPKPSPKQQKASSPVNEEIYINSSTRYAQEPKQTFSAITLGVKKKLLNGSVLGFALMEGGTIAGQKVEKGQIVEGVVKEENGRIYFNIKGITIKGKRYPVKIKILDEDGEEGLGINEAEEDVRDDVLNEAGGRVLNEGISRIPVLGGAISSVIGKGKQRKARQKPIHLDRSMDVIVAVY